MSMHALPYVLEPATSAERSWLEQLRRDAYRDLFQATWGGWDEDRHQRHFNSSWEQGGIRIISLGGTRVGMLQIFEGPQSIEIAEIQIRPEFQNQRIGSRLMEDVASDARNKKKRVTLSTGLMNTGAIRLYLRLGFCEISRSDMKVFMKLEPV
jgi:ribosomal protein S18 acetylase RimI-like enzyme